MSNTLYHHFFDVVDEYDNETLTGMPCRAQSSAETGAAVWQL